MVQVVQLGEAGWLAPGRWRGLRSFVWMVGLALLCVLAYNLAAVAVLRGGQWLTGQAAGATSIGLRLISIVVGCAAILAVYTIAVHFVERRRAVELAVQRLPTELAAGLSIGGALIAAIVLVNWAAGWTMLSAAPVTHVGEALRLTLRSALVEELLMRLIFFRLLWRSFGLWPALLLSAMLFGALHMSNPGATAYAGLCLLVGEGLPIAAYMLTGRLWASVGIHAGWNFAQGWLFGAVVSGMGGFEGGPLQTRPAPGIDAMLSGGAFGPEASLACLILSLGASIAALWFAIRHIGSTPPASQG